MLTMSDQLAFFQGSAHESSIGHTVSIDLIRAEEAMFTLARAELSPKVDIDIGKLPSVLELQRSFVAREPITLVSSDGIELFFYALVDLDHNGWLYDGQIKPPDFVIYEGVVFDKTLTDEFLSRVESSFDTERENRWVLLVEPGGNYDGSDTKCFGWSGDPLIYA
jgi:hypothetical protein